MRESLDAIVGYLDQLDSVLDSNAIDEVGITLDASLPPIYYTDGKLGVAKTILKPLFKHALESIYRIKLSENSVSDVCKEALSISRVVLLIKGDFPIAFDMRKRLIEMDILSIKEEITFTSLLYTRHPKCPSGWHHRRWCLMRNKRSSDTILSAAEIETERELCRQMAEKHPKNYYAWMHRLWVMKYMSRFQLEDELFFTKTWLQSHVSDHSAVNHRLQVIRHILTQPETLAYIVEGATGAQESVEEVLWVTFVEQQFQESEELIRKRPGHEALWYLRRSLLELLFVKASEALILSKIPLQELGEQAVSAELVASLSLTAEGTGTADGSTSTDSGIARCRAFTQLACTLLPSPASAATSSIDASGWLAKLLSYEMRLARHGVNHTDAWDYAAQRTMATRYAAFLLDRALHYVAGGAAPVGGAEGQVGEDEIVGAVTLRAAVTRALQQVCTTLQAEGKTTLVNSSQHLHRLRHHYSHVLPHFQILLDGFGTIKRRHEYFYCASKITKLISHMIYLHSKKTTSTIQPRSGALILDRRTHTYSARWSRWRVCSRCGAACSCSA